MWPPSVVARGVGLFGLAEASAGARALVSTGFELDWAKDLDPERVAADCGVAMPGGIGGAGGRLGDFCPIPRSPIVIWRSVDAGINGTRGIDVDIDDEEGGV